MFSSSLAIYPSTDNANFSVKHHDQQYKDCRSFTPLTAGSKGTENFNWNIQMFALTCGKCHVKRHIMALFNTAKIQYGYKLFDTSELESINT